MALPNLPNEQPRDNQKNIFLRYPKSTLIVIGVIILGITIVFVENWWIRGGAIFIWVLLWLWLVAKNPESRL